MKRTRFHKIVSLILVLCMLLSFCSVLSSCKKNKNKGNDNGSNDGNHNHACTHESTTIYNQKDATCYAEGYTGDTVCTSCTAVVATGSVIPMTDHTYDSGKTTKNATCIEQGIKTITCTGCGITKISSIPTVPHKDEYHDDGAGQHNHTCTVCALSEKSEHTPTNSGVTYDATCTEGAYTLYTCADCESTYKVYDTTKPALDHAFPDEWTTVESTCMTEGTMTKVCTREDCNEAHTLTIPVAPSCTMVFIGYENGAPTCSEGAIANYACKDCGTVENKDVAATGIHNYVELENTGDGFVRKECSVCHDLISSFDASTLTAANVSTENIKKDEALEMNMKEAAIQFPSTVVSEITSGNDLAVSAGFADETKKSEAVNKITDTDKQALLQNAPVYDFTVSVDNQPFTENFATEVAITIPYDNGDNDAEGIVIYYIAKNGEIEAITNVVYNAEKKEVSFFVKHFSFYAVAYEETQEMKCKRGNHNYVETGIVVTATCYQFGYTDTECTGCKKHSIENIVEREAHNYGEIIPAEPTCENGAWSTRVCSNPGCHSVLNVTYTGSLGHKMDHPATCDTAATCVNCNKVLARPLGHTWTAWETVREATAISEGLRRRYCLNCGEMVEDTLSTTGTIEAIKYSSYSEFVSVILEDILGIAGGSLAFNAEINGVKVAVAINVMKKDNGHRLSAVIDRAGYKSEFYYDNGVFVAVNGEDGAIASTLDSIIPLTIDVYRELTEEVFAQIDAYATEYLILVKQMIGEYKSVYAEDINAMLEAAGLPYTVDDVDGIIDSIETVYAYLALKLGYTTEQDIKEGVVLPSKKDFQNVLALFMETTENAVATTYTLTAQPILDLVNAFITFYNEHAEDTIGEFIYFAIEEDALASDPTLTSFEAIIDLLATNFPGTYKVSDAVKDYVAFSEESGFLTLEQLCAYADMILAAYMGEGMSAADFIDEYSELTLDQVATMIMESETAAINDVYTMLKDMAAAMTVADLSYNGMTLAYICDSLEQMMESTNIALNFSVSFDKDGNLVGLTLAQSLSIDMGPDAEPMKIDDISLTVVRDDATLVEVPDSIAALMVNVSYYYDADGNLVITGLLEDAEYDFSLYGTGAVEFKDALVKDDDLSALYGKDIYVLKEAYWNESSYIGEYILIDGKYYDDASSGSCKIIKPKSALTFDDIKNNVYSRLNKEKWGYLVGTNTPVYAFSLTDNSEPIGITYQEGGVWMIATRYGYVDDKEDEVGYYVTNPTTVDNFVKTLKVGLTTTYPSWDGQVMVSYGGNTYDAKGITISYGTNGDTVLLESFYVGSKLYFFNNSSYVTHSNIFSLNEEVTLPEHDYKYTHSSTIAYYDTNGNIKITDATYVSLYNKVPSYYLKATDELYLDFASLNGNSRNAYLNSLDTSEMSAIELPDGNTLYVIDSTMDNDYGYKFGYTTVYGYAKVASGVYTQAAVLYNEAGEIVDVLYRYASEYASFDELSGIYNLQDYITVNGGTYTVSAELIEKLKALCPTEKTNFYFEILANHTIGNVKTMFTYIVGSHVNMPEIDISDMDSFYNGDYKFWTDLFGNANGTSSMKFDVVKNDDGSITIIYPVGTEFSNVSFPANTEFPADGLWTYDAERSEATGLKIYTCKRSRTTTCGDEYIYRNGKYYYYDTFDNYTAIYANSIQELVKTWRIQDTTWRFNMIGAEGLPENLPVYQTTIEFGFNYYYPHARTNSITVYTFVLDGVMNVAVKAEVRGESLLVFESYTPLEDYMNSLVFERTELVENHNAYINGTTTTIYNDSYLIYEPTATGEYNQLNETLYVSYVKSAGADKYIRDLSYINEIVKIGSEAKINVEGKDRYERKISFYNGTLTVVYLAWTEITYQTISFVELAGRMYRYGYDDGYGKEGTYEHVKIPDYKFNETALDKVWYYAVEDIKTGERTYYTEFIPSDYGFTPSGEQLSENPEYNYGSPYSSTLLGYTAEGSAIYEVAFYVETNDNNSEWTEETIDDRTVFLHKTGTGYLKITENYGTYYVKATKIQMADGTTEIFCSIRSGVLFGNEMGDYAAQALKGYVTLDENKVTFSAEFLEIAKNNNRNQFYISLHATSTSDSTMYLTLNYYQLESLFLLGNASDVVTGNGGNGGIVINPGFGTIDGPNYDINIEINGGNKEDWGNDEDEFDGKYDEDYEHEENKPEDEDEKRPGGKYDEEDQMNDGKTEFEGEDFEVKEILA